jgi:hypothetical protein
MNLPRLITAALFGVLVNGTTAAELEDGFRNPPDGARPWVYWTQSGEYSLENATADLEAMQKAGIGGVLRMDCSVGQTPDNLSTSSRRKVFTFDPGQPPGIVILPPASI